MKKRKNIYLLVSTLIIFYSGQHELFSQYAAPINFTSVRYSAV